VDLEGKRGVPLGGSLYVVPRDASVTVAVGVELREARALGVLQISSAEKDGNMGAHTVEIGRGGLAWFGVREELAREGQQFTAKRHTMRGGRNGRAFQA
jgi:hypothetical protein